ncbi:TonB-dependent receptor plug domain-containing protein [Pseudoxanthomonas yeongjuensis]|uniref:TonB-dependent receptor plug domain-containing protein n=1 Tax=Pseudoxanthomonas yeongjuensis TaxID=377616 RepID=UPI001391202B|nr:TonB-dependent receptor [Pseudoxanthomonas yeongjuensis]
MKYTAIGAAILGALMLSGVPRAYAQTEMRMGVTGFETGYFSRSQPATAYDMVILLPGLRPIEGDADLRGYAGTGGNILIDGQRPASKGQTLEEILKRIPASAVERVELVRSGAAGVDMQGYAVMANVVRIQGGKRRGRIEVEDAFLQHGFSSPRAAAEFSSDNEGRTLDVAVAIYREIDDEHGFGIRNRYAEDGTLLRQADYEQPEGETVKELSGGYRFPLAGGSLKVNALLKDERMFADIKNDISYPLPQLSTGTERVTTKTKEVAARFERPLSPRAELELLASISDVGESGNDTSRSEGSSDESREVVDARETILRGVYRHKGDVVSFESGAEGALNVLDSHTALRENGIDILLPFANVRVEEQRVEIFSTATWLPSPAVTIEVGARYEFSKLAQTGDSTLSKSLSFLKPRLLATWAISPADGLRGLIEREVGQLDFANFAGSASLTSGTVTAGNQDLEPDRLWRIEAAWEHRFVAGSLVVAARHEKISDVVDRIPTFTDLGVFDSVGNIGDGKRQELEANLNLPFDRIGLNGVNLQANALWRRSRVTDPATGESRRISGDLPLEAGLTLSHDIPARKLRWGVDYAVEAEETEFKVDEIQTDVISNRVDLFVEYKPTDKWSYRLFAKNLTDGPATRTRYIYDGLRGASPLNHVEKRVLKSGPYVGFAVQRSFGG